MAKRFRWRLDPVKKVKEREEEKNQEALAAARRQLSAEEAKLAELGRQRAEAVGEVQNQQQGAINPQDLARRDAYIRSLDERIQTQTEVVASARNQADERHQELVKSVQERKVLENLKDRDKQRFQKDRQRREQAAADETANRQSHERRTDEP